MRRHAWVAVAIAALVAASPLAAQDEGFDPEAVVLAYHRLTGDTLDLRRIAEQSDAVRRASSFDRQEALEAVEARMKERLVSADAERVFRVSVNDRLTEYDHARGEFSIGLFTPGTFLPVQAFGQAYQVAFANAAGLRAIPMPKEEARAFDAALDPYSRGVLTEIEFRVTGRGDPAGGVTGPRVVRAEVTAARVLNRNGGELYAPRVAPSLDEPAVAFDAKALDVAGLRVGEKSKELEVTLTRLYGPVTRRAAGSSAMPGIAQVMTLNELGCTSLPGRPTPSPGAVCVTAQLDDRDVVRILRVERLFPWFDGEVFRSAMISRYGAVADAKSGSGYSFGWGPEVNLARAAGAGRTHALTASYGPDEDFMSRGGNALPRIAVSLQLVDAAWASASTN